MEFTELGVVTSNEIFIENESWGSITEWKEKYDNAITDLLNTIDGHILDPI